MAEISARRRVAGFLGLFLLLVAIFLLRGGRANFEKTLRVEKTKMLKALGSLETGVSRELIGGGCHEYSLALPAGHFIQVAVEQLRVDLVVHLSAPDGTPLLEVDSPIGDRGHERLSMVAEEAGDYVLKVCSGNDRASPGYFRLSVEGDRPATEDDRRLIAALAVFAEGEGLRRQRKRAPAIEKYRAALEVFRDVGDVQRQAEALHRICWQSERLGHLTESVEAGVEAVERFRDLGELRQLSAMLNRTGAIHRRLGNSAESLSAHREALEIARGLDDAEVEAGVLNNLGLAYRSRFQLQAALESFREALVRGRGTPVESSVWHNLGDLLMRQGRHDEAHDALRRSLSLKLASGGASPVTTWNLLGDVLQRLDRPEEAIEFLEKSLAAGQRRGNLSIVAATLNNLANALLKANRHEEALARAREAAEVQKRDVEERDRATVLMTLGRIHRHRDELEETLDFCGQAQRLFKSIEDPWGEAASRLVQARALRARGAYTDARDHLEVAVELVESLRGSVVSQRLRMSFLATRQSYYELLIDTLMQLAEQAPDADQEAELAARALHVNERRQARSLLEMLAEAPGTDRRGRPELVALEKELQRRINGLASASEEAKGRAVTEETVQSFERRQRALLLELDALREQIRGRRPASGDLSPPMPLTLGQIRDQVVDPNTLLLIYALGEERSFLWSVTANGMSHHVLPRRRRIERAAAKVYQALTQERHADDRASKAALSEMLLGPVADRLGHQRLAIVAEGRLLDIPFAVLPDPAAMDGAGASSDEERFLLANHEIVYLPSASVVAALRRELRDRGLAPAWLAAVADPVFDVSDPRLSEGQRRPLTGRETDDDSRGLLEPDVLRSARALGLETIDRLPASANEARSIAGIIGDPSLYRLLVGFDARREEVIGDALAPFRILHFATHGFVNRDVPELSGLVLSLVDESGEDQDGFLRAHEIYNLELSAELVVLSACETGLGKEVEGEGQMSLTRGFMYAGVPRILVSRWRVSDRSTAELMERFYFGLIKHGLTPPAALRCAQLSMRAETEWRDPRHWAGFVVEGEWRSLGALGTSIEQMETGVDEESGPGSDLPRPGSGDADRCRQMRRGWQQRTQGRRRRRDGNGQGRAPRTHDSIEQMETGVDEESGPGSDLPIPGAPRQESRGRSPRHPEQQLIFGVNGSTGQYLLGPMTGEEIQRHPGNSILDPITQHEREWWVERYGIDDPDRAPVRDVDPADLASAGWGILYAPGVSDEVKEALEPLVELRREQASRVHPGYFFEETYRGQSKEDFLASQEAGFGPANPENLPYYLLIVGDPTTIPFRFQYELDVQYAVGRIHFDRAEDYANYAKSVLAVENGTFRRPKNLTFFGVSHDPTTELTAERLVKPLSQSVLSGRGGWQQSLILGEAARKARLKSLLGSAETPSILFTASHGLEYEPDDPRQLSHQGALLCQDWPGPSAVHRPIDSDHFFSANDLKSGTDLTGLIAIHFACYSAGTPELDNFSINALGQPQQIAPHPFISSLGKRMLSCGALAALGHVDRAWTFSFSDSLSKGDRTEVFDSLLKSLVDGLPLGAAMEYVNQRYAELSVRLSNLLMDRDELRGSQARLLARVKRANNDARNYIVLGDPAVRLYS